jgi:predicted alpha/beta-fold hydrolase
MSLRFDLPPFEPHPLLRNRHAQTLAGTYLPATRYPNLSVHHRVALSDGDAIMLHDDTPDKWSPGGRVVLMIHGLAGSHASPYMSRAAGRLNEAGVRTFRMDMRGCGAGAGMASRPYHAGRSDDALSALHLIQKFCPDSPVTLVGFSLSGNIVLKLLGEAPDSIPENVVNALAVCPAIDLGRCVRSLVGPMQRTYDRYFVRELCGQIRANCRLRPELAPIDGSRQMKSMFDFDDQYTGPVCGFGSADNYYAASSATPHIERIRIPTLILAAKDDPLVPVACFDGLRRPANVLLHLTARGGHLGYIGKRGIDPDCRWMDWRIVDWVRANLTLQDDAANPGSISRSVEPAGALHEQPGP